MTLDQIVKSAGIQRKIDELGRIVIPIEVRRNLGWGEKHKVEIVPTKDGIFVKSADYNPEKQEVMTALNNALSKTEDPTAYNAILKAAEYIGKG